MDKTEANVVVIGTVKSGASYAIRDFLHRSDIPFQWIDVNRDPTARARLQITSDDKLPVCLFPDGTRLEQATVRQITQKLGWFRNPSWSEYDVAIYGGGPAGLSAAVYGASEGLKTVLIERFALGGQAASIHALVLIAARLVTGHEAAAADAYFACCAFVARFKRVTISSVVITSANNPKRFDSVALCSASERVTLASDTIITR